MCQINVVVTKLGVDEPVIAGISGLEVTEKGIIFHKLFEDPVTVSGVRIKRIDFQGSKVILEDIG